MIMFKWISYGNNTINDNYGSNDNDDNFVDNGLRNYGDNNNIPRKKLWKTLIKVSYEANAFHQKIPKASLSYNDIIVVVINIVSIITTNTDYNNSSPLSVSQTS